MLDLYAFHQYGSPVTNGLNWGAFFAILTIAAMLLASGIFQFSHSNFEREA